MVLSIHRSSDVRTCIPTYGYVCTLTIIKSKISVRVSLKIKMENLVLIFATSIWETANPSSYSKLLVLCPLLMTNFCKSNYINFRSVPVKTGLKMSKLSEKLFCFYLKKTCLSKSFYNKFCSLIQLSMAQCIFYWL